ncbi:MAG: hypothetical protein H0V82_02085 [Candidatus Protochlamydia sp.]|nr:hypothetical protein [Candidatus Protochlamydia sp.]
MNEPHNLPETLYVLETGYEEKRKITFDADYHIWKYAIRGKSIRDKVIRIIVAFDEDEMLVIRRMGSRY